MNKNRKISLALLATLIIILSFLGYQAWCAYQIWSNTVQQEWKAKASLTLTSVNGTDAYEGDTVEFRATLTDGVVSGKTVYLYEDNVQIDSATTDSVGDASFYITKNSPATSNYNATTTMP